ncbi:MAG: hypothetical protein ACREDK_07995 [Thermoplasmata archaeon]
MPVAVLVRGGVRVHWVNPGGGVVRSVVLGSDLSEVARDLQRHFPNGLPSPLGRAIGEVPPVGCVDPLLADAIARLGRTLPPVPITTLRAVRESMPLPPLAEERAVAIALAHAELDAALRSPEESLISLAREEERVERAARREEGAADQFLVAPDSPIEGYVAEWSEFRDRVHEHHARLLSRLEQMAGEVVPNLAAVVGPRVAARLVAYAPGLFVLARMSASRLQLLGARRRPSTSRGPRYGLLYRAARMADVPPDRGGAYARSLAALAVIAVRADALTHTDLAHVLVARRDRRIERLVRRRGR